MTFYNLNIQSMNFNIFVCVHVCVCVLKCARTNMFRFCLYLGGNKPWTLSLCHQKQQRNDMGKYLFAVIRDFLSKVLLFVLLLLLLSLLNFYLICPH